MKNNITVDRHNQINDHNLFGFFVLFAIFTCAASIAGIHGTKLLEIGGLTFDAGLLTISLTFLCTDIVSEVYGKFYTKKLVIGGFISIFTALIFSKIVLVLPASSDWELSKEYISILDSGNRIFIASIIAYTLSQFVDITIFTWIRNKTKGKYLWLRNNLSTMIGGLFDAVIFSTIAFYGVYELWPIIASAYIVRIIISIVDTPIVYLGVFILRKIYPELRT